MPVRDRARAPAPVQLRLQSRSVLAERRWEGLTPDLEEVGAHLPGNVAIVRVEEVVGVIAVASVDDEGSEA